MVGVCAGRGHIVNAFEAPARPFEVIPGGGDLLLAYAVADDEDDVLGLGIRTPLAPLAELGAIARLGGPYGTIGVVGHAQLGRVALRKRRALFLGRAEGGRPEEAGHRSHRCHRRDCDRGTESGKHHVHHFSFSNR